MSQIRIENLSKAYQEKELFHNLNLTLEEGHTYCFFAPSGRGKTTLLRILLGLETPDSGRILGLPDNKSVVFQEDRLCESFSALTNVSLVLPDSLSKKEKNRLAVTILKEFYLEDSANKPVHLLSRGMKRRVSLARALMYDAPLLILDEPFEGLDAANMQNAADVIKEHYKGRTILLVTHSMEEAMALNATIIEL